MELERPLSPHERKGNAFLRSREAEARSERWSLGWSPPSPAIASNGKKTISLSLSSLRPATKTKDASVFFLPLFLPVSPQTHLEVGLVLDLIEVVQRCAVVELVKSDDLREEDEVWQGGERERKRREREEGEHGWNRARSRRSNQRWRFERRSSPLVCTAKNDRAAFFLCAKLEHGIFTPQRSRVGETRRGAWCPDAARKRPRERCLFPVIDVSISVHEEEEKRDRFLSRPPRLPRCSLIFRFEQQGVVSHNRSAKAQMEKSGTRPRKGAKRAAAFDANILKNSLSTPNSP